MTMSAAAITPSRFSQFLIPLPNGDLNLDLSGKNIKDSDIPDILSLLASKPAILDVDLSGNALTLQGVESFAKGNKTAKTVNFTGNIEIGDKGITLFAMNNLVVTKADFSACNIGPRGASDFSWNNKVVTTLYLRSNHIGDNGFGNFARYNKKVSILDLTGNDLSYHGAEAFSKRNKMVTTLCLNDNSLGNEGALRFIRGNNANSKATVSTLFLADNNITPSGMRDLLQQNEAVIRLNISSDKPQEQIRLVRAFLNVKTTVILLVDESVLAIPARNALQRHNEKMENHYISWMAVSTMLTSSRSNSQSRISMSVLSLLPCILNFAGNPEAITIDGPRFQDFMQMSYFSSQVRSAPIIEELKSPLLDSDTESESESESELASESDTEGAFVRMSSSHNPSSLWQRASVVADLASDQEASASDTEEKVAAPNENQTSAQASVLGFVMKRKRD